MPTSPTLPISAELVGSLPGSPWLREARQQAWADFSARELPTESEEIWRYSRIDELQLDRYHPDTEGGPEIGVADLPDAVQGLLDALGHGATVVVSRNGGEATVLRPQEGATLAPATGPVSAAAAPPGLGGPPPDVWTDLNGALVATPWRVTIEAGAELHQPLVVVHWVDGDGVAVFPRLEVELGDRARATVVEVVAGGGSELLAVPLTRLRVGAGAHLGFGHVQVLGAKAWQLGNQVSSVARDGRLVSMTVALGGDYARVRTDSVLLGPGAESQLLASYFGSGQQMHDLRTVQHHAAPQGRSDLLFKGAVANNAASAYSGLIRVEKGAKGTNAFQTNRNLVLSEGARAYSVPNLEIEDNDVRCSHASAVGPIDESQLFYLESRGVPDRAAQRLVALGFLDDVLERFPAPAALGWLRAQMAAKLDGAGFGSGEGRP